MEALHLKRDNEKVLQRLSEPVIWCYTTTLKDINKIFEDWELEETYWNIVDKVQEKSQSILQRIRLLNKR